VPPSSPLSLESVRTAYHEQIPENERGGEREAAAYSLIGMAKVTGVGSETWLRHVLAILPTIR
jgi:hypothetical protein